MYCVLDDLKKNIPEEILIQLTDDEGLGTVNQTRIDEAIAAVNRQTGHVFGDSANPLLVSVRSGARASMPGMMDTVLNLGLNDESVKTLAKTSGDERFAYDSYRRFIQMYSNVVLSSITTRSRKSSKP